ncbi:MAG: hypothetical protein GF398_03330 [Chitinivibrionales bacterium]|nr:hypothetical protein [Chitinivibrionales bacterium]
MVRKTDVRTLLLSIPLSCAVLLNSCGVNDPDGNSGTPGQTIEICGDASGTQSYTNTNAQYVICTGGLDIPAGTKVTFGEDITLTVKGKIDVAGELVIGPGAVLKFDKSEYLRVGYSGSGTLKAQGTEQDSIYFIASGTGFKWGYESGTQSSGGIWLGNNTTSNTSLQYCVVSSATTGVYCKGSQIEISNCRIASNLYYGIEFNFDGSPVDSASFLNNVTSANAEYGIYIEATSLGKLSGTGSVAGNTQGGIFVDGDDIEENAIIKKHDAPYVVDGTIDIGSTSGNTVTIRPGAQFRFNQNAYVRVGYSSIATLIAQGTASDSIIMTNNVSGTSWGYSSSTSPGGIYLDDEATSNTSLRYVSITNATNGIYVKKAAVEISNSTISSCDKTGVEFDHDGSPKDSASFLNNVLTGNGDYGIKIEAHKVGNLSGTGSVAGNTKGGILIEGDDVEDDAVWKKHDAPYIVDGTIDIGATGGTLVTIRPGAQFELLTDAYFQVGYSGVATLAANGTQSDPITFTASVSGTYWGYDRSSSGAGNGGIYLDNEATSNTSLTWCTIEKATNGIYIDNVAVTVQNCTIKDSEHYAVYAERDTDVTGIADNTYSGNGKGDVYVKP